MLGAPLHAQREVAGDGVLAEVLPQGGQLPRPGPTDDVQLRQVRGEGADNDRGGHEGKDPDDGGVEAFEGFLGRDLVHAARELRQGPLQRDQVLCVEASQVISVLRHPSCTVYGPGADTPPAASNEVGGGQHKDSDLGDAQEERELVRLDALRDRRQRLLHSHEAQQPHHACYAEDASQAEEARPAAREGLQSPVRAVDEQVQSQPGFGVLLQDETMRPFHCAVLLHDGREGRPKHVGGPEDASCPLHDNEERVIFGEVE
mmetsp:Transcript_82100/g.253818  ORF Transcript_82100/g.253818 Transcript_82100/m.253818 type:complete len:260 (-) Transcript_82100:924-1703(-)